MEFCNTHRRIRFRKVKETPALPVDVSAPTWQVRPGPINDAPAFPGLRLDKRGILVADQGVICLADAENSTGNGHLAGRLNLLLAGLSQDIRLDRHVRVTETGPMILVWITPPDTEADYVSRFFDAVAAVADLNGGQLYIGKEPAFIRYRDGAAPRGYDAEAAVSAPAGDRIWLADTRGAQSVPTADLAPKSLADVLLGIRATPVSGASLPATVFLLTTKPLLRLIARYFHNHRLQYRLARFVAPNGEAFVLFAVSSRPEAHVQNGVPSFVLSYLAELPRCTVLTETAGGSGWQLLTQWQHRYPCLPDHVAGVFGEEGLLIVSGNHVFPNLHVSPLPVFFEGDDLLTLRPPHPAISGLTPEAGNDDLPFDLPVRLVPDNGPAPATAALLLDPDEVGWVRHLFYRLPAQAFQVWRMCAGQTHSVLLADGISLDMIPFGIPMRRFRDTTLFLPLRDRLAPEVSWHVLADALQLKDDICTFLNRSFRMDMPKDAFVPISRVLKGSPVQTVTPLEILADADQPFAWNPPAEIAAQEPIDPEPKKTQKPDGGILGRLFGNRKRQHGNSTEAFGKDHPTGSTDAGTQTATGPEPLPALSDTQLPLQDRARHLHETGDFLGAAVCYALSKEPLLAARCYQEAAAGLIRNK